MANGTQDVGQVGGTLWEFGRTLKMAWRLWRDGAVPWWAKTIPLLSVGYLLFPIDLLADPMLGLGQLDDLAVLLLGLRLFISACPAERVQWYKSGGKAPAAPTIEGQYRVVETPWENGG